MHTGTHSTHSHIHTHTTHSLFVFTRVLGCWHRYFLSMALLPLARLFHWKQLNHWILVIYMGTVHTYLCISPSWIISNGIFYFSTFAMFYNKHCCAQCMCYVYSVLSICFISVYVFLNVRANGGENEQAIVVNAHNSSADLMVILVVSLLPWNDDTTVIFISFSCRLF